MVDFSILALTMATLGQVGLCVTILAARSVGTQTYLPLAVFFAASGIIAAGPAVAAFVPALETHFIAITLPGYLLLGPALWLYVEGLTSEVPWSLRPAHGWHLAPVGVGLLAAGLIVSLPLDVRESMFIHGELVDRPYPSMVVLFVFLVILGWIGQSGYYVIGVFRRLALYRQRLKDLFASNEQRELRWVGWLLIVIGGVWVAALTTVISENFLGQVLFSRRAGAVMALLMVWSLALWGLRQKPGFEGRYLSADSDAPLATAPEASPGKKYQRSALGDAQAQRIAAKIEAAMIQDQLYLDPTLSLHKLAKHVSISPNYISQTLNETVGETFFDYVNKWRINAAKPRILAGNETVLDTALAVGFNARSSFYKAFKLQTGQTPSEFARTHQSSDSA